MRRVIVQESDFDAAALQRALHESCAGAAGAIASFTGYVRDHSPAQVTETLFLEHYPGMCERELQRIGDAAMARWALHGYVVLHRYGALPRKAQIVFVAAASAHRGDAFQACEYIMDALKTRAPFWKRETLADGQRFWVQAQDQDLNKTSRWEDDPRPNQEPAS